jgi:CBS domain-containing protein
MADAPTAPTDFLFGDLPPLYHERMATIRPLLSALQFTILLGVGACPRLASGRRPDGFRSNPPGKEAVVLISDVLRSKGHNVVQIRAADSVALAVRKLAEHRIGALVVEDRWMKLVGVFSERDFVNAIARDGAAALGFDVEQLMSSPIISCHTTDRIDAALAAMTVARIRHLPVIDDGNLKGIVSIGDLVKQRLDEKELEANVLLEISRMRA